MPYDKIELVLDGAQWWARFTLGGAVIFEGWIGRAEESPGKYLDALIEENKLEAMV